MELEEENTELTEQQKNDLFIHVCYKSIQNIAAKVILILLLFIAYVSLRLYFRGNALLVYFSYKQLLYYCTVSFFSSSIYSIVIISHLSTEISLKKLFFSILEGITLLCCYLIWGLFIFCIIFIGFYSLSDFRYGFSVFPIIKFFLFGVGGLYGLQSISHLLNIGKSLSDKKPPFEIISYIHRYKLMKE